MAYRPLCRYFQQEFICLSELKVCSRDINRVFLRVLCKIPVSGRKTQKRTYLKCLWYRDTVSGLMELPVWLCSQHTHLQTHEVHMYLTLISKAQFGSERHSAYSDNVHHSRGGPTKAGLSGCSYSSQSFNFIKSGHKAGLDIKYGTQCRLVYFQ